MQPANRHGIAAIRRDVEIEHRLIELQVIAQRLAERRVIGQFEYPARGLGETKLARGSEHALRLDPAQLRRADRYVPG